MVKNSLQSIIICLYIANISAVPAVQDPKELTYEQCLQRMAQITAKNFMRDSQIEQEIHNDRKNIEAALRSKGLEPSETTIEMAVFGEALLHLKNQDKQFIMNACRRKVPQQ